MSVSSGQYGSPERERSTYVFPGIGKKPIREVAAVDVLECLRRLEQQNTHETVRRVGSA